jgi:hypothetical protein
MKIQHHFAALLLATVLFAACNKEDQEEKDEEPNTGTVCRPSTVYLYGISNSGDFIDTLLYTYADAGVAKVTGPDYYFTFDYSGGRIVRRNYFEKSNGTAMEQETYETITYNSDGTIAKVESYYLDSNSPELDYLYEFTYSSGKLTKHTFTWYLDGVPSGYTDTHFYTYTGNNITRDSVVQSDPYGTDTELYYYTYDTAENHFSKSGTNALFHSAIAMDMDGGMLPFFFSANNVIKFREAPDDDETHFSYTTDAKGNLTMMKLDDMPGVVWKYECP